MTTILIVEDEKSLLDEITTMLGFEDYDVIGAQNGDTGLHLARDNKPDLIVSDVMMPKLDGYGMLEALRADPATATIPVIFMTAKADRVSVRRGMDLGADDYITKPFTHDELLNAIDSRLRRQHDLVGDNKAPELEHAKQELARLVAHELRTPLVSISTVQEVLKRQGGALTGDEIQDLLETLDLGSQRLRRLVEQIVLFTQVQSGALDRETIRANGIPMSLWDILTTAVDLGRRYAFRNANLPINLTERDREALVLCEPRALKHAIAELITNALVFSPADGAVMISHWVTDHHAHMHILDQGHGIPEAQLALIQEPFYQFDRATHEQQGIGLGLYLAREIVNMHDGKLSWKSVMGRGTQVSVRIPFLNESQHPA